MEGIGGGSPRIMVVKKAEVLESFEAADGAGVVRMFPFLGFIGRSLVSSGWEREICFEGEGLLLAKELFSNDKIIW